MKFKIPCETYYRLSRILSYFQTDIEEELYVQLNCIRLENKDGYLYAIATNKKIAVVEKIGKTDQPNGVLHVVVNEELINQVIVEKAFNSSIEFISIPAIATASATTTFGFNYSNNAGIFLDENIMDNWRDWGKEPAKKSKGAMFMNMEYIKLINEASPSGRITFPEFIDVSQPVVLNDVTNPDWVGLFLPQKPPTQPVNEPAVLPEWW